MAVSAPHQSLPNDIYPKVSLPRLPQHVHDVLFAGEGENEISIPNVTGIFKFEGKDILINNSFKRRREDDFPCSRLWMSVYPNLQKVNKLCGTDDCSDLRKGEASLVKRTPRWKGADEQGEYEVQKIVDHRFDQVGRDQFFVKWVGWGSQFNTWEPLSNLNCEENLHSYTKKIIMDILFVKWLLLKTGFESLSTVKNYLFYLTRRPVPSCKKLMASSYLAVIEQWVKNAPKHMYTKKLSGGFNQKGFSIRSVAKLLEAAVHEKCSKRRENIVENIKDHCALLRMKEIRKDQLKLLKIWEDTLNSVGPGGLIVENQVDLEGPSNDFMFITQNKTGPGVDSCMLIGQVAGCECTEECGTKETCCPNMAGVDWAYSVSSRLIVSPRSGIFECNRLCSCGPECPNRVVQRGRKVKLCIFRTANGRGWGLKAGERIEKGAFLTTYLGEIITSEEAAARDVNYEKTGLSYLFDLDLMDPDEGPMFTIDAMKCGNESHYINHSCDPNAHVAGVWIETNDPAIPILALFARRTIRKGEEITFNYQGDQDQRKRGDLKVMGQTKDPAGHSEHTKRKAKNCKCGSRICKGFYF